MHGETYPPMSLANAIEVLNSLTFDVYQEGTLRATEKSMSGDNIKIAIQQLIGTVSNQGAVVAPVVPAVANDGDVVTEVAPIVVDNTNKQSIAPIAPIATEPESIVEPETTGFDSMVRDLPINTTRTEANKKGNGRTYYESPEFDTSTKEGRDDKKKYDQWKFKNMKAYRRLGIELPSSKIKR
jgi:hypothetical protein